MLDLTTVDLVLSSKHDLELKKYTYSRGYITGALMERLDDDNDYESGNEMIISYVEIGNKLYCLSWTKHKSQRNFAIITDTDEFLPTSTQAYFDKSNNQHYKHYINFHKMAYIKYAYFANPDPFPAKNMLKGYASYIKAMDKIHANQINQDLLCKFMTMKGHHFSRKINYMLALDLLNEETESDIHILRNTVVNYMPKWSGIVYVNQCISSFQLFTMMYKRVFHLTNFVQAYVLKNHRNEYKCHRHLPKKGMQILREQVCIDSTCSNNVTFPKVDSCYVHPLKRFNVKFEIDTSEYPLNTALIENDVVIPCYSAYQWVGIRIVGCIPVVTLKLVNPRMLESSEEYMPMNGDWSSQRVGETQRSRFVTCNTLLSGFVCLWQSYVRLHNKDPSQTIDIHWANIDQNIINKVTNECKGNKDESLPGLINTSDNDHKLRSGNVYVYLNLQRNNIYRSGNDDMAQKFAQLDFLPDTSIGTIISKENELLPIKIIYTNVEMTILPNRDNHM